MRLVRAHFDIGDRDEPAHTRVLQLRADELRQSTPFAGALTPQERWKIWRETKDRFFQAP